MDLNTAIILFLLITIIIFFLARMSGIKLFSSLILGLVIGYLVMISLRPPQSVEGYVEGNCHSIIYLGIGVFVSIMILIYVIYKSVTDRECIQL